MTTFSESYEKVAHGAEIAFWAAAVAVVLVFVAAVFACVYFYKRKQRRFRDEQIVAFKNRHENESQKSNAGRYVDPQIAFYGSRKTDEWELDRKNLTVLYDQKLGSGAFANVYRGHVIGDSPIRKIYGNVLAVNSSNYSNCQVAVKVLPEHADFAAKNEFLGEVNFMKDLGFHRHLVNMVGCVTVNDPICLVSEFCEYGDLLRLVREHKGNITSEQNNQSAFLTRKDLLSFAWQISDGLAYLASKGCVHRDVAARNILVNSAKIAKVGDFGLCRLLERNLYTTRGGRLPLKWMAVESLVHYEYTTKSDIWSFGVLLYEVFTCGEVPYSWVQPVDMADHLRSGKRLPQPDLADDELYLTPLSFLIIVASVKSQRYRYSKKMTIYVNPSSPFSVPKLQNVYFLGYALMQRCWCETPTDRPTFEDLRESLAVILDHSTESYGYLDPTLTGLADIEHSDANKNHEKTTENAESDRENGDLEIDKEGDSDEIDEQSKKEANLSE